MGVGGVGGRLVTAAGPAREDMPVSVPDPTPNNRWQATANSVRSCLAPAFGGR
jgi:hypothetical protein